VVTFGKDRLLCDRSEGHGQKESLLSRANPSLAKPPLCLQQAGFHKGGYEPFWLSADLVVRNARETDEHGRTVSGIDS